MGTRLTREADGADITDVDNLAVAKARGAEVDMLLFRLVQVPARGWAGQETHLFRCSGSRCLRRQHEYWQKQQARGPS